jgi:hypothetical protein
MVGVLEDGQPVSIILQVQLVVLHVRTHLQHLQELPPKNSNKCFSTLKGIMSLHGKKFFRSTQLNQYGTFSTCASGFKVFGWPVEENNKYKDFDLLL